MSEVIRIERPYATLTTPPMLPEPETPIRIRPAVPDDYDFIDDLQAMHKKGVGFFWESAIKGHIKKGNILVAESGSASGGAGRRMGYVMGVDRYMKRDELGIIYQMNVLPEFQRSLVAAHLLKAKFENSAYGCRLYCCWCAQDLTHANRFWEAMGFVPLAFRTGGGRQKGFDEQGNFRGRMHIFWQKRIREGDVGDLNNGGTAYWFPSITGAGAIGEDRLVLPIPPGTHWSDAKPVVVPEGPQDGTRAQEVLLLESDVQRLQRDRKEAVKKRKAKKEQAAISSNAVEMGGLRFGPHPATVAAKQEAEAEVDAELKEAKKAVKQAKKKFDPVQEKFARELKDRWLEQVLDDPHLIAPSNEKYAVTRRIQPNVAYGESMDDRCAALQFEEARRLEVRGEVRGAVRGAA